MILGGSEVESESVSLAKMTGYQRFVFISDVIPGDAILEQQELDFFFLKKTQKNTPKSTRNEHELHKKKNDHMKDEQ